MSDNARMRTTPAYFRGVDGTEFSSLLKFVETRWNLDALTDCDTLANDLLDSFDFEQTPLGPLFLQERVCP